MTMKEALEALATNPTISVAEYGTIMKLPRSGAYESVDRGDVEILRLGRSIRIISAPLRERLKIKDK